jgi:LasA protease
MRPFTAQPAAPLACAVVALSLAFSALACSRADVPSPAGSGSPPVAVAPSATVSEGPPPTPEATATESPAPTLAAPVPLVSPTFPPTVTAETGAGSETVVYESQAGDTPRTIAVRFGVLPSDLASRGARLPANENSLVDIGTRLIIPRRLTSTGPAEKLIPDSEVVFSPNAADFNVSSFARNLGGYLTRYQEYVGGDMRSGPEVVAIVARDNSVNPRLLLALLEYQSGWVTNPTRPGGDAWKYPMGRIDPGDAGLYHQLVWAANELGNGYYGWRSGTLTEVRMKDGIKIRLAPELNAGTVALQWYFSLRDATQVWAADVGPDGFLATYQRLFGDPEDYYHPLYEPGLEQPEMILPFLKGRVWSFTGGPHGAWEREAAWAALDFAPSTAVPGCTVSDDWAVAAAPGLVVRSGNGVVILDLDGDGREQTGWDLLYLHIASSQRVAAGTFLQAGDLIGHPSCEGGVATGTHIHIARKYNGEWILADGALPFTLSGWQARAGTKAYEGALVKEGEPTVLACPCASKETLISR